MTLGIYINWGGTPVLVSDVVLTGGKKAKFEKVGDFPTTISSEFAKRGRVLSGLCRKMALVTRRISYCWAGSLIQAQVFHGALMAHLAEHGEDTVGKFTESYPREDCDNIELILAYRSAIDIELFLINAVEFTHDSGRSIVLIGSGIRQAFEILNFYERELSSEYDDQNLATILSALFHISTIGDEAARNAWGGGFEACRYANGGFGCLDRIIMTTVRLMTDRDRKKTNRLINEILVMYDRDILILLFGGSFYSVNPHYRSELPENLNVSGAPRMLIAGFQLEYEPILVLIPVEIQDLNWIKFQKDSNGLQVFVHHQAAIDRALRKYQHQQAARWNWYVGSNRPTKIPKGKNVVADPCWTQR